MFPRVLTSFWSRRLYSFELTFAAVLRFPDSNLDSNFKVLSTDLGESSNGGVGYLLAGADGSESKSSDGTPIPSHFSKFLMSMIVFWI